VSGDGSPGTKAEFTQLMMGMKLRIVDRTVEERHNADGSTDWRWQFEGTMSGSLSCHHQPSSDGTDVATTFDYVIPGSVLGKFAERIFLEKQVRHDFEDSMDDLKLFAETRPVSEAMSKTA
jgi:coenzyme Q-binding protein COQ10